MSAPSLAVESVGDGEHGSAEVTMQAPGPMRCGNAQEWAQCVVTNSQKCSMYLLLHSRYTTALTFENLCQRAARALLAYSTHLSARPYPGLPLARRFRSASSQFDHQRSQAPFTLFPQPTGAARKEIMT